VLWRRVTRCDPAARALADRHYSRQTIGAAGFLPPGTTLTLLSRDGKAVWGVCENLDPAGNRRWRVTIFRNESEVLSSVLVREATVLTFDHWRSHYGDLPPVPLTTEVDPGRTRRKRDPGRCFLRSGLWRVAGERRGLVVLEATL
jgi:hypothetical protein